MNGNRLVWALVLCLGLVAWGCGDDGGTKNDDVSDADTTHTDVADVQPDEVDPCAGLTLCAAAGTSCDVDMLVTCAADANGCLVETTTDCAASSQTCDDTASPAVCVDIDPCEGLTLCDAEARTCDTTNLVVCAADANGCLIETITDCTTETGANTCLDALDPIACGFDPCLGVSDCTTAGAACTGDSLVTCAADGFGCLVESTTDCTTGTSGACDATNNICTSSDVCSNPCTEGVSCEGNELVVCAEDAFGCFQETRFDCATTTNGYCDANGTAACAIDTTDRCAGETLCSTTMESMTCAAGTENLVTCAFDSVGCLIETTTDCSATAGEVCIIDGAGDRCGIPCTDATECTGATEGDTSCVDNDVNVCTDNNGDGCLELVATDCLFDICNATTGACDANGIGDSCADPIVVFGSRVLTGADIELDFTDTLDFADPSCSATSGAVEAIFSVSLLAGQTVYAQEYDDFPSTISFTSACDGTAACALSANEGSAPKTYTASADETVYVVYESQWSYLFSDEVTYAFVIDVDPSCGNGRIDYTAAEECDDGNAVDGDGCSSCAVDFGWECVTSKGTMTCTAFPDLGDFNAGDTITDTTGGPITDGETDGYTITFNEDVKVSGALNGWTTGDADIYIYDESGTMVASSAAVGDETWQDETLPAGSYVIVIYAYPGDGDVDAYTLSLSTVGVVCGDATIEGSEECEDGNTNPNDGCSATCRVEPGYACDSATPNVCHAVVCGDGIIEGAEACDDLNTTPGDGCAADCSLEAGKSCFGAPSVCFSGSGVDCSSPLVITEDSVIAGSDITVFGDNQLFAGTGCTFAGATAPEAIFEITLQPGEYVTCSEHGGLDAVLRIAKTCDNTAACESSQDGSETTGVMYTNGTGAVETVYCVLSAWSSTPSSKDFEFHVEIAAPGCGNGVIEPGETCDDGGTNPGDGCSDLCAVEAGKSCFGEPSVCYDGTGIDCSSPVVVAGTTNVFAGSDITLYGDDHLFAGAGCTTAGATAPEAIFEITLQAGEYVTCSEHGGLDAVLRIAKACDNTAACEASIDSGETTGVTYTNMTGGAEIVFCVLSAWSSTPSTKSFEFHVDIMAPVCGNDIIEPGETCDDGGTNPGDGCSDLCAVEAGKSCFGEPSVCYDGTGIDCSSPVVVTGTTNVFAGSDITVYGDDHLFAGAGCTTAGATAPEAIFEITLQDGDYVTCSEHGSLDAVLRIAKACDNTAACEASIDLGETTGVTYTNTTGAPETVYCVLSAYSSTPSSKSFELHIDVMTPGCGNGALEGSETCDDLVSPAADGDGCSATCTVETGWTCSGEPSVCILLPTNDICADAIDANAEGTFNGSITGMANDYNPGSSGCTNYSASGADVVYTVTVPAGSVLTASASASWDMSLYAVTDCADMLSCVAGADDTYSGDTESISWTNSTGGDVVLFIVVDTFSSTASGPFTLDIAVTP